MKDSEIYAQTNPESRPPMLHLWTCNVYAECCDTDCSVESDVPHDHPCDCEIRN